MRVILDVSSLAWRCLLSGTDEENGFHETDPVTGKERYINSAAYGWDNLSGYLKRLCDGLAFAPKDMILVLDGAGGRQLRSQFHSAYKAGRDKSQAMYDQFGLRNRAILICLGISHSSSSMCTKPQWATLPTIFRAPKASDQKRSRRCTNALVTTGWPSCVS